MGLYDHWPYTNFHELNLSWLLRRMMELSNKVDNFVSLNTIKYADPIQWDITTQYETNTVVIDPNTGTAYISVQPVPSGVNLTNSDYWTVIFDLSQLISNINQNLTVSDAGMSATATFPNAVGDWLLWNGKLYEVISDIQIGYAYVEDANIKASTVEELVRSYVTAIYAYIGALNDLATTNKTSIVNAINELVTDLSNVMAIIGDLSDLATTDKTSIVNAINEIITIVGNLSDLATADKSSIVNAINEIITTIIGNLSGLKTTDKSSIVNAINEVDTKYHTFEEFGAVGDGITDDSAAVQLAFNSADSFLLEPKTYLISRHITVTGDKFVDGNGATLLLASGSTIDAMYSQESGSLELRNCIFDGQWQNGNYYYGTNSGGNMLRSPQPLFALMAVAELDRLTIDNCVFKNAATVGLAVINVQNAKVTNNRFESNLTHGFNFRRDGARATDPILGVIANNIAYDCVVGIEIIGGYENLTVIGNEVHDCYDSKYFPSQYFSGTYPNIYPNSGGPWLTPTDAGYVSPALLGDGSGIELTNFGDVADMWSPKNINVTGNTARNCQVGIRAEGRAHDVTISSNSILNCNYGIFCFSSKQIDIIGNTIRGGSRGIQAETFLTDGQMCSNINVSNNNISYTSSSPIMFFGVANSSIIGNNTITSANRAAIDIYSLTDYVSRRITIADNVLVKDGGSGTIAIRVDSNVFGCCLIGNMLDGWNTAFNGYTLNMVGINNGMTNIYCKEVTIAAGNTDIIVDTSDIPFTIASAGIQATPLTSINVNYYAHVESNGLHLTLSATRTAATTFAVQITKVQQ